MGGTLLAILIGGISAAVIATLVTRAVEGQRAIIDRDEMSEFSLFVKGLLTNDSACSSTLFNSKFLPGGRVPISLAIPYGRKRGPITKGFTFADDQLIVKELSLEDRGDPAIPIAQKTPVNRYMARVRLQLSNAKGLGYRTRFFDFPVLVNAEGEIKGCNNEFGIAEACQAMGFEWNTATSPPVCQPKNACLSGGMYKVISGGLFSPGGCGIANAATGSCKCPAGFTDTIAGSADLAMFCGRFCFLTYNLIHQCSRCPQ